MQLLRTSCSPTSRIRNEFHECRATNPRPLACAAKNSEIAWLPFMSSPISKAFTRHPARRVPQTLGWATIKQSKNSVINASMANDLVGRVCWLLDGTRLILYWGRCVGRAGERIHFDQVSLVTLVQREIGRRISRKC